MDLEVRYSDDHNLLSDISEKHAPVCVYEKVWAQDKRR